MEVNIINKSNNPLPSYETLGSSGMDIRAFVETPLLLKPNDRVLVPTGLYIELPQGFEAQIRPRSGLALKHGISMPNTPGTVDSDYRGELKIILINLSTENFEINSGDRIAQMVISKYEKINWRISNTLNETQRGEGGFGSTGK